MCPIGPLSRFVYLYVTIPQRPWDKVRPTLVPWPFVQILIFIRYYTPASMGQISDNFCPMGLCPDSYIYTLLDPSVHGTNFGQLLSHGPLPRILHLYVTIPQRAWEKFRPTRSSNEAPPEHQFKRSPEQFVRTGINNRLGPMNRVQRAGSQGRII